VNDAPPIRRAGPERLADLAGLLGRAFEDDAMIQWPLGFTGTAASIAAMFEILYEVPIHSGMVWEAGEAEGVAVWVPPGHADDLMEADRLARERFAAMVPDGGARYAALWEWIDECLPAEPVWYLDAIAVGQERRGMGVGSALVRFGLAMADRDGVAAFLETSRERNVAYYERFGFRVTHDGDAPGGGPHIWFMRR
jgi:ribosomal protein S18 acetylase RimI-like enzyme